MCNMKMSVSLATAKTLSFQYWKTLSFRFGWAEKGTAAPTGGTSRRAKCHRDLSCWGWCERFSACLCLSSRWNKAGRKRQSARRYSENGCLFCGVGRNCRKPTEEDAKTPKVWKRERGRKEEGVSLDAWLPLQGSNAAKKTRVRWRPDKLLCDLGCCSRQKLCCTTAQLLFLGICTHRQTQQLPVLIKLVLALGSWKLSPGNRSSCRS